MKITEAVRSDVLLVKLDFDGDEEQYIRLSPGNWLVYHETVYYTCNTEECKRMDKLYGEFLEKNIGQVA